MSLIVYLNGQFLPYEQATIPIEDRSFLLADGIYEVVRVYGGRPFRLKEHLRRLARSAGELRMPIPDLAELEKVAQDLLIRNDLQEATVYFQVSRGAYTPRTHAFPTAEIKPLILMIARSFAPSKALRETGGQAVTVPDQRWARCDIKSVALLPNVLAKQRASDVGAFEAIFVKDGYAIEGSSSNFMAVVNGEIWTYPQCNYILGGITRDDVLALARKLGYTVREVGIPLEALATCTEAWVTSTTSEVLPIVGIDGRPIGTGRPGPIARALYDAYMELV